MSMHETSVHDMGWLILVFALSASTACALVILFAWHAYLISTAQVWSSTTRLSLLLYHVKGTLLTCCLASAEYCGLPWQLGCGEGAAAARESMGEPL